ncbi:MLO-like protein 1 isoform X2 [Chenopodium quinoa]|uniref:MLO-like protein 1 isoform X2 n=1 Tax=Chenopodium quinoa TaxID=63459 RepID=UPI000B782D22|nr:MLO-like protein 1 isoform X2 [Chenopodium quinoa]
MAGGGGGGLDFKATPSWVIGSVVFVIVVISLVIEKFLSYLGKLLKRKEKKPLNLALKKIKEELMLLGFISLLLTVFGDKVHTVCIPEKLAKKWLPCNDDSVPAGLITGGKRGLLAGSSESNCDQGKVPFISSGVLHDVHYLIFILAVVHVLSCILIVLLGEMKIFQWRKWEDAIRTQIDADYGNNQRVLDVRNLSFVKDRFDGNDAKYCNYVISFFKHLAGIVTKADYTAMRTGFILTHCDGNLRFNFHKYIVYAYEADFNKIVSISWFMWLFVVISLTLNVSGWNIYFAIAFIPFILLLVVGTKLEQVITELAIYIAQRNTVVFGELRVQPSDDYFWFNKPKIVLLLIHTILFINSFGSAIYFWTWFKFGLHSCEMGTPIFALSRIILMLLVQTICSYSTLPLFAIVTQMGSSYNKEAMERYGSGFNRPNAIADRTAEGANAAASIEMANHQEQH